MQGSDNSGRDWIIAQLPLLCAQCSLCSCTITSSPAAHTFRVQVYIVAEAVQSVMRSLLCSHEMNSLHLLLTNRNKKKVQVPSWLQAISLESAWRLGYSDTTHGPYLFWWGEVCGEFLRAAGVYSTGWCHVFTYSFCFHQERLSTLPACWTVSFFPIWNAAFLHSALYIRAFLFLGVLSVVAMAVWHMTA